LGEITDFLTMSDGFKLFVRHWVPLEQSDKTVVCIHGLSGCCGCFKNLGTGLSYRGMDVWGFDLRGFGNSKEDGVPRGDTKNFKRHLNDIDEAIQTIRSMTKCKKLYLLGHSLGALYALWYGATYLQAVDGLVLLAPAVQNKHTITPKERTKFALAAIFSPKIMINTKNALKFDSLEMAEYLPATSSFSVRYFMGLRRFLMQGNMFINASKDKKPTLIIQGNADEDALPIGAKQLFDNIASEDKKLEIITGAKHTLFGAMLSPRGNFDDSAEGQQSVLSLICNWLLEH